MDFLASRCHSVCGSCTVFVVGYSPNESSSNGHDLVSIVHGKNLEIKMWKIYAHIVSHLLSNGNLPSSYLKEFILVDFMKKQPMLIFVKGRL